MQNTELIRLQLNSLVTQARQDLFTLSTVSHPSMNLQIIQRLWDTLSSIHFLSELLANQVNEISSIPLSQQPTSNHLMAINQPTTTPVIPLPSRNFTIQELANYDGKNGRPAYVAVNNTVYDVTNNRAWAAASHFALPAGKEYSQEFASCHAGQQSILATLPIVGRLTL